MCPPCLPDVVWTLVFRLLSHSDRLRVRASCKHFRDLVDNSSVWRDFTAKVGLFNEEYPADKWSLLRRWRVSSARVDCLKDWKHIAKQLPGLKALEIEIMSYTLGIRLWDLKCFTNLERLHLCLSPICLEELFLSVPQSVTHLSVITFRIHSCSLPAEIPPDSPFKKLKSLFFMCEFHSHPVTVLHFFLSFLPQLQHLSLSVSSHTSSKVRISRLPPLQNCSLSSLELDKLVDFPENLFQMLRPLPLLQSLAVLSYNNNDEAESLKLCSWMRDLPALTSLTVACPSVSVFAGSVPSSLTRFTLVSLSITTEDLKALSVQLPNLRHLHLKLYDDLGSDTALIPRLFPKLKTLSLFHEHVPEDAFLSLASLKELEVLETLDKVPLPAALVSKLRELTNNRVQFHRNYLQSLQACHCSSCIPEDYCT